MKEAGCQFCEFFKLGIFKNWAFHIENQNKLLHFPEIGLQLHFILSKIVLDFMMNRSWVLNFTFWMRLKANWVLGRSDLWNLLLVVWVAVRENWKYCVPAPYQLFSLFLCPPIPVNKLESNKKNWDRVRRASDVREGRNRSHPQIGSYRESERALCLWKLQWNYPQESCKTTIWWSFRESVRSNQSKILSLSLKQTGSFQLFDDLFSHSTHRSYFQKFHPSVLSPTWVPLQPPLQVGGMGWQDKQVWVW